MIMHSIHYTLLPIKNKSAFVNRYVIDLKICDLVYLLGSIVLTMKFHCAKDQNVISQSAADGRSISHAPVIVILGQQTFIVCSTHCLVQLQSAISI